MKKMLCYMLLLPLMATLLTHCNDAGSGPEFKTETCRSWQAGTLKATGVVSIEIDGVTIPVSDEWNVGISPIIRHDGHDIKISACVPFYHYFEEVDDTVWGDGWTFESTWQLNGSVAESGDPLRVAAPSGVHRPGMFAAMSQRDKGKCGLLTTPSGSRQYTCDPEVTQSWFALMGGTGEMFVEHWEPLDKRFVASGWVRAADDSDIHIKLDLSW